jgi:hypothetical protein
MITPESLTISSPDPLKFFFFTVPIITDFFAQSIFNLLLLKNGNLNNWKYKFNILRAGGFITVLLIFTGLCTLRAVQLQRTLSAAFLVAITITPTGFVPEPAIKKLLQPLQLCVVHDHELSFAFESILAHNSVTLSQGQEDPPPYENESDPTPEATIAQDSASSLSAERVDGPFCIYIQKKVSAQVLDCGATSVAGREFHLPMYRASGQPATPHAEIKITPTQT